MSFFEYLFSNRKWLLYRWYWLAIDCGRLRIFVGVINVPAGHRVGGVVSAQEFVHVADVPVGETWARLKADPAAVLIDVRTRAEWSFVGVPDLASMGRRVMTLEWQSFPEGRVDDQFADRLEAGLKAAGAGADVQMFFICRSGGRSRQAAEAMAAAGYTRCSNVADGFEGPLDDSRHRGHVAGWKAAGLPWMQG